MRGWNAKTERQAIARTLRPQQTHEVHAEFVHLGGSLDEYQAQVCQWKQVSEFEAIDLLEPEEVLDDYKHLDRIINEFVEGLAALHGLNAHEYRASFAKRSGMRHSETYDVTVNEQTVVLRRQGSSIPAVANILRSEVDDEGTRTIWLDRLLHRGSVVNLNDSWVASGAISTVLTCRAE